MNSKIKKLDDATESILAAIAKEFAQIVVNEIKADQRGEKNKRKNVGPRRKWIK